MEEEEADDLAYDIHNDETFGDPSDTDWETAHAQALEEEYLNKSNKLCESVAACILDDKGSDETEYESLQIKCLTGGRRSNQDLPEKIVTVEQIEAHLLRKASLDSNCNESKIQHVAYGFKENSIGHGYPFYRDYQRNSCQIKFSPKFQPEQKNKNYYGYPGHSSYNNRHQVQIQHHSHLRNPVQKSELVLSGASLRLPKYQPMNNYHHKNYRDNQSMNKPFDEYANLMLPHEKRWVAATLNAPLTSNFRSDYYYLICQQKKNGNKLTKSSVPVWKDINPHKAYTNCGNLDNCLGRVQILSIHKPKLVLDLDGVEMKRARPIEDRDKALLLEIEQMYNLLLAIEEVYNPLCPLQDRILKNDIYLIAHKKKLVNQLVYSKKLVQVIGITKGSALVLRLLPYLDQQSSASLINILLLELVVIIQSDKNDMLLSFLPFIRKFLNTVSFDTILDITSVYETEFLLTNKFLVSLMTNILERVSVLLPDCSSQQIAMWRNILLRLIISASSLEKVEKPVVAIDPSLLRSQLALIEDTTIKDEVNTLVTALSYL